MPYSRVVLVQYSYPGPGPGYLILENDGGRTTGMIDLSPGHQTVVSAQNSKHRQPVFFLLVILTAADRNSEIMHARSPQGTMIFSRFWIDILMNNDRKYTYNFERALHENMNYVLIDTDPWAILC